MSAALVIAVSIAVASERIAFLHVCILDGIAVPASALRIIYQSVSAKYPACCVLTFCIALCFKP